MDTLNTTSSTPFSEEDKLKCPATSLYGLPRWLNSKEFTCNAGKLGLIPGSGRCPGDVNGNPLQYSYLENPMDGGAWWATVHGLWVRHNFATKHHHHHHQTRLYLMTLIYPLHRHNRNDQSHRPLASLFFIVQKRWNTRADWGYNSRYRPQPTPRLLLSPPTPQFIAGIGTPQTQCSASSPFYFLSFDF